MKIKVGDLAKIYDLSNQSLHYYENKNLICSTRDVINNYRVYDCNVLSRLGIIKKYRNAGVNIDTITHLMKETENIDSVQKTYQQQIKSVKEEIRHSTNLIHVLEDLDQKIEYCKKEVLGLEDLSFFRVDAGDTQIIFHNNQNKEFFSSWFKNILFTRSSYQLYLNDHVLDHFHYGMACDTEYKEYVNIDERVSLCSGKFLVLYCVDRSDSISSHNISTLLDYAEKHHLKLDKEAYYEIIQSVSGENSLVKYCRLLFKITC